MQQIELQSPVLYITEESRVLDRGIIELATITIEAGVRVEYAYIPLHDGDHIREIHLSSGSTLHATSVIATRNTGVRIVTLIEGDGVTSDLHLLALATDGSTLRVEGISRVDEPYRQIHTRVDQTNILIGQGAKVSGLPILQIATDDVEGGHSCKIHRIGGDELFYLESRGLPHATAEQLLLDGEICRHLETVSSEYRQSICQELHTMIQKK